ncbi:MAG: hypothetical protein AB1511_02855 [Deinococcota bacterium]
MTVGAKLLSKGAGSPGELAGLLSPRSAKCWWDDPHRLFLASINAISAFAAEQLGCAVSICEIVGSTFTMEKFRQHRMFQEILPELLPIAVLERTSGSSCWIYSFQ